MRFAVIGAKGMLGSEAVRALFASGHELVAALDVPEIDIADADSLVAQKDLARADAILNCAAYTNVEKAEEEEALATRVNGEGVRQLALYARARNIFLVHVSTDFVFDGARETPYPPDAPRAPLSAYGRSKLTGELALEEIQPRCALVRTAWLFGPGGKNFVESMLMLAERNGELSVVCDQVGAPTCTLDLAPALIAFAEREAAGVFHYTNAGVASWHQFACEIVRQSGLSVPVLPITATEAAQRFGLQAARPRYSVLDCSAADAVLPEPRPAWADALARYLSSRKG